MKINPVDHVFFLECQKDGSSEVFMYVYTSEKEARKNLADTKSGESRRLTAYYKLLSPSTKLDAGLKNTDDTTCDPCDPDPCGFYG